MKVLAIEDSAVKDDETTVRLRCSSCGRLWELFGVQLLELETDNAHIVYDGVAEVAE